MANAQEPKYMMGLAACFHMQKNYNAAAQLYMIVSTLDPKSPIPYFHASDCHIQLEDPVTASIMLQMAIKHAEGKPEFKVLKERCEITLSGLKKEVKEVL
jgi:type III secretion system low calcium response chaperone LcrH/SycD